MKDKTRIYYFSVFIIVLIFLASCKKDDNSTPVEIPELSTLAIDEEKLYEVQAGFTKGKSTVDQVFVLQSLVSKYISKKRGRCYSVFIDFTKAFDNVSHLHLFYSLIKNGLHGRVIRVLRDMYCKLQSSVQDNIGRISEAFTCSKGTRQGCMLSS